MGRQPEAVVTSVCPKQSCSVEVTGSSAEADHHVLIVGGGFGGLTVAQQLAGQQAISVTLLDRRNHHLFQPLLYQVATAVLSPGEIAQPLRGLLGGYRNVRVLLGELHRVDHLAKTVYLLDGDTLSYDTLVLATGATHSYFGHPEWERFAPGLKSLEDARRIREQVLLASEQAERAADAADRERLTTFVIIGGGPTGVEMAGAIAGLARQGVAGEFRSIDPTESRVILIEAAARILGSFPIDLSAYSEQALMELGVTVLTGQPVEDITAAGVMVGGAFIPTATVVWAAGVKASPVAEWLGIGPADRNGHVRVAPDLSVPECDGVYVLGDAALFYAEDGTALPGLAQVAHQQGRYLGRALRARIVQRRVPEPFRFRTRGNLAIIGRNAGVVQWGTIKLRGFFAWVVWGVAHIYLLNGFQNRLIVTLRWLWAYVTSTRGARLIG